MFLVRLSANEQKCLLNLLATIFSSVITELPSFMQKEEEVWFYP